MVQTKVRLLNFYLVCNTNFFKWWVADDLMGSNKSTVSHPETMQLSYICKHETKQSVICFNGSTEGHAELFHSMNFTFYIAMMPTAICHNDSCCISFTFSLKWLQEGRPCWLFRMIPKKNNINQKVQCWKCRMLSLQYSFTFWPLPPGLWRCILRISMVILF